MLAHEAYLVLTPVPGKELKNLMYFLKHNLRLESSESYLLSGERKGKRARPRGLCVTTSPPGY